MAKISNAEFIAAIKEMSVLELNDLVKAIEEEFGVTAAAPVAVVAGAAPVEEEKSNEVNLVLVNAGAGKIGVIKLVREVTGLGLKEAKELVDGAPKPIKEKITPEEAESIKAKFVEAGAEVEIK